MQYHWQVVKPYVLIRLFKFSNLSTDHHNRADCHKCRKNALKNPKKMSSLCDLMAQIYPWPNFRSKAREGCDQHEVKGYHASDVCTKEEPSNKLHLLLWKNRICLTIHGWFQISDSEFPLLKVQQKPCVTKCQLDILIIITKPWVKAPEDQVTYAEAKGERH